MTAKEVLCDVIEFARRVTRAYLSDFTDDDLLVRPIPEMNHVAWMLGHLIRSEHSLMTRIDVSMPDLPPGFVDNYTGETSRSDDPKLFKTKDESLALLETDRSTILTALDAMTDDELDEPVPESMHRYARTVAAVFRHVGTHELMHAGHIAAVRRKLGKPVLI
ncbi:MAG TPA: DinB family protein [Phycisphaerae bacterium]|nr:DinB family protein [Phycisphaerae bacterium]